MAALCRCLRKGTSLYHSGVGDSRDTRVIDALQGTLDL
jgi:hypothetical protein